MTEIPDKRYFKIGEVSKLAAVAPHVLRYWEREFSDIKPMRAHSRQRLYRRTDVELILVIKDLLHHQGYTISGAKKLIATTENDVTGTVSAKKDAVSLRLGTIKEELLALKKLLHNEPP